MPKCLVLSTLTDHGLKTLKENPDRLTEIGSRGSVRLMTLPAEDAREFVKSLT